MKKYIIIGLLAIGFVSCKKKEIAEPIPQQKWIECLCIYTKYAYDPINKKHWSKKDTSDLLIKEGEHCRAQNYYYPDGPTGGSRRECDLK